MPKFQIESYVLEFKVSPSSSEDTIGGFLARIVITGPTQFHGIKEELNIMFYDKASKFYLRVREADFDGLIRKPPEGLRGWVFVPINLLEPMYSVLRSEKPVYFNYTERESDTGPRVQIVSVSLTTGTEPVGELEDPPTL